MMLHIHKLGDLNQKNADIECFSLLRQVRGSKRLPLLPEQIHAELSPLLITSTDLTVMKQAAELITPIAGKVIALLQRKDFLYESINLERTLRILEEIAAPLQQNIKFAEGLQEWLQQSFTGEFTAVLNRIPTLRAPAEKQQSNEQLSLLFQRLLRNKDLRFSSQGLIHEAHTTRMNDLDESMVKGFFFHVSLEEELKKLNFDRIKLRLAPEKLQEAVEIHEQIKAVRKGIERAYETNKRLVELSVILYAYVKWAMQG
ncbi:MAG: hypothetical protein Q8R53_00305 [Nanoarchaeota archaeon]|nr:hypothetical protein [Nanoarchaeota archaeon]